MKKSRNEKSQFQIDDVTREDGLQWIKILLKYSAMHPMPAKILSEDERDFLTRLSDKVNVKLIIT